MCQGRTHLSTCVGLLLAWLVAPAIAPVSVRADEPEYPASRLGTQTAPLLLLSRADVRTDLALSPEQIASAERTMSELYVRAAAIKGKTGPSVLAARRAIDEAQKRWIDTELNADQRTRLIQIDLQWEGPAALVTRPVMAESLRLTDPQRQSLKQAVEELDRKRAQGPLQPADERKLAETALALLTPAQRKAWRDMLGKPFVPQVAARTDPSHPPR
jgi:hypothetical protein